MIEKTYRFAPTKTKMMEKIVVDENVNIAYVVLPPGDEVPPHYSNANVYMTVLRGTLSITLGEQDEQTYQSGTIVNFPQNTMMGAKNKAQDNLELFVVKSPAPTD
jgi:quercetin dioxygenase-like cupin family protein